MLPADIDFAFRRTRQGRLPACDGSRYCDLNAVGRQDALFDANPTDVDKEYIKWRDTPQIPSGPSLHALGPKTDSAPLLARPLIGLLGRACDAFHFSAGDAAETPQAQPLPPLPPMLRPFVAVKATSTSPELSLQDEFSVQEPTESLKSPANQEQEPQITSVVEAKPIAAPEEQPPQQEPIESESPANQELQISMCEQIADHVDQAIFLIV
jgi:hypothetical protein